MLRLLQGVSLFLAGTEFNGAIRGDLTFVLWLGIALLQVVALEYTRRVYVRVMA